MGPTLSTILDRQSVFLPDGKEEPLHSGIDRQEVAFLQKLIKDYKVTRTLEVGCAMGISSLAICEAISDNSPASVHTIIDPYQGKEWKNIGVNNLRTAGFTNFNLVEERSEFALPKLVSENLSVELAFIDGWHTFDHTLVDFFYINRLLKQGGILVVDDVSMPAVKKVMRMVHTYPCYKYLGSVTGSSTSKGKLLDGLKAVLRPLSKVMGKRLSAEVWSASVINPDRFMGLNASVIAFQKISEDRRPWNWFEPF